MIVFRVLLVWKISEIVKVSPCLIFLKIPTAGSIEQRCASNMKSDITQVK